MNADERARVHLRVLELYDEVDREVRAAGPVCVASGRCCRFKEWGHVLFLSSLEADLLLGPQSPQREQGCEPALEHLAGERCPYQKDNLCTAREPRPLGCRIYYCDPSYQQRANEITEKYLRRLKDLADELHIEWRYAPLHHFLADTCSLATTSD